ncbi:DUF551 domain-containing protein [Salmonella enterica]|nr:DUF551 domain-containing protein [Salmonella enterica]
MTTITKEWLQQTIAEFENTRDDIPFGLDDDDAKILIVLKRALASLYAESVRYLNKFSGTCVTLEQQSNAADDVAVYMPLYAAPPVPVVPEEKPMPNPLSMYAVDAVAAIAEVRGWNACRAAMLHGAEPVSQTYKLNELSGNYPVTPDGWISCSERMPEIRQTVIGWNGYAVRQCVYTRNEYAKTQKGREPRFETLTGIWHGVTHWIPLPEPPQEVNRG